MSFVEDTVTENKNYNKKQIKNKVLGFKIFFYTKVCIKMILNYVMKDVT